jgi:hypothetical protein
LASPGIRDHHRNNGVLYDYAVVCLADNIIHDLKWGGGRGKSMNNRWRQKRHTVVFGFGKLSNGHVTMAGTAGLAGV